MVGRRDLLRFGLGAAIARWASGCRTSATPQQALPSLGEGRLELYSWFDLPNDPRSRELSGIAWDERSGVLWAVQDESPQIIALKPDKDLRTWSFGETIPLSIEGPVDLEGLILLPDGFVVCSEIGPRIIEVDRQGRFRREVPIPSRFKEARANRSLESLTVSPTRHFVFTTSETALDRDGGEPNEREGSRIRIVRISADPVKRAIAGAEVEYLYETDPAPVIGSDWGVADLAALDDDNLLVLERGWKKNYGNTVRIYQVTLDQSAFCQTQDVLSRDMKPLPKRLRVDLAHLPTTGLPTPHQVQPSPLLDNFEGLAIGPRLKDGRPTLLLASDDNNHATQVARILVLTCATA